MNAAARVLLVGWLPRGRLLLTQALSKLAEHYAPQVTPPSVALQLMTAIGLVITGTVASAQPALRVRRIPLTEALRAG